MTSTVFLGQVMVDSGKIKISDVADGLGPEGTVEFTPGLGDGIYNVHAEIVDMGLLGKRIARVTIECFEDA